MEIINFARIKFSLPPTLECLNQTFLRICRAWVLLAAATILAAGHQSLAQSQPPVQVQSKESQSAMSPADALAKLREGNARFVAGQSKARNLPAKVLTTSEGQY